MALKSSLKVSQESGLMYPCLSQLLDTVSLSLQPCREDKTLGRVAPFRPGQPWRSNSAKSCQPPILSRAGIRTVSNFGGVEKKGNWVVHHIIHYHPHIVPLNIYEFCITFGSRSFRNLVGFSWGKHLWRNHGPLAEAGWSPGLIWYSSAPSYFYPFQVNFEIVVVLPVEASLLQKNQTNSESGLLEVMVSETTHLYLLFPVLMYSLLQGTPHNMLTTMVWMFIISP